MKKSMSLSTYILPLLVVGVLGFMSFMILQRWKSFNRDNSIALVHDLDQLKEIFDRIHKDCTIIGFDQAKTAVDFLNVKSFTGSEVGGMSLMYPDKWRGPYITNPIAYNTIDYQIVQSGKGYYLVPGDGVTLPNGKKIGTDIILNQTTDIDALAQDPQGLSLGEDKPLAVKIPVTMRGFGYVTQDELEDI